MSRTMRCLALCGIAITLTGCFTNVGTPEASPTPAVPTQPVTQNVEEINLASCRNLDPPASVDSNLPIRGSIILSVARQLVVVGQSAPKGNVWMTLTEEEWPIGLSPNGNWFALGSGLPPSGTPVTIRLQSSTGDTISHTLSSGELSIADPTRGGGWTFAKWASNDLLLAHINNTTQHDPFQFLVAVVDPFSGNWRQDLVAQIPERYELAGVAFSPDLTRVMYVAGGEGQYQLVLWDLDVGEELWRRDNFQNDAVIRGTRVGNIPIAWSNDSSKVAFVDWSTESGSTETGLTWLDRDGIQLTNIMPSSPQAHMAGISWSPNGRYLAYVARSSQESSIPKILVYDSTLNQEVEVCRLRDVDDPLNSLHSGSLSWSPDGRFLAYSTGNKNNPLAETNAIVLLDLTSGEVTEIQRGPRVTLVGWSTTEQWLDP